MGSLGNWNDDFSKSRPTMGRQSPPLLIAMVLGICITVGIAAFTVSQAKEPGPAVAAPEIITQAPQTAPQVESTIDVVVPVRTIRKGEFLSAAMFKLVKRPKVLVSQTTAKTIADVVGRYANSDLPGEIPVQEPALTATRAVNEVIAEIPDGYRAVTIQTNATTSVEGWARAGAMVDVHWIGDVNGERTSDVLVQNAKVLSAERSAKAQSDPSIPIPSTVTLLVKEKDAARIALAATGGSIVLQLRGTEEVDGESEQKNVVRLSDILDGAPQHSEVQGFVKIPGKDGTVEEWAVIKGKLHRKGEVQK